MVAGDLVNTASRLQSVAPPGTVLVGEATHRAASRGDRLRGGRRAGAQGQDRPGPGLARPAGGRRARRPAAAPTCSSRRSSAATRSCGCSRSSLHATGRERRARLVSITGSGRDRQEPARLGAREVHRRARRDRLLAPRPLAVVRRGDHLLGPRRDGPAAGRPRRDRRRSRRRADADRGHASPSTSPTDEDRAGSSRRLLALLGPRAGARRRPRRPVRGLADLLRADRRAGHHGPRLRGPPVGRQRACSTSSSTCSSGRERPDPRRHPRPAGAARAAARLGRRDPATSPGSPCEPLSTRPMRELLVGPRARPARSRPSRRSVERADGIPLYAVETVRMLVADGPAGARSTARTARPATWASWPSPRRLRSLIASAPRRPRPADRESRRRTPRSSGQTFTPRWVWRP